MMEKTEHTPGPWEIDDMRHQGGGCRIYAPGEYYSGGNIAHYVGQENARLIAAAPELLASLRRVVKMLEIHDARLANSGEVEEARLIISRAEGAPYWGE